MDGKHTLGMTFVIIMGSSSIIRFRFTERGNSDGAILHLSPSLKLLSLDALRALFWGRNSATIIDYTPPINLSHSYTYIISTIAEDYAEL